jgi:hypothetical protein
MSKQKKAVSDTYKWVGPECSLVLPGGAKVKSDSLSQAQLKGLYQRGNKVEIVSKSEAE